MGHIHHTHTRIRNGNSETKWREERKNAVWHMHGSEREGEQKKAAESFTRKENHKNINTAFEMCEPKPKPLQCNKDNWVRHTAKSHRTKSININSKCFRNKLSESYNNFQMSDWTIRVRWVKMDLSNRHTHAHMKMDTNASEKKIEIVFGKNDYRNAFHWFY